MPSGPSPFDEPDVQAAMRRVIARALAEDLGDTGDITTAVTVPALTEGTADVVARQDGVVAGLAALTETFSQVDPRVKVDLEVADGQPVVRGDVIARIEGRLRSLLTGERVALNLLGHLSGIATHTAAFVRATDGTGVGVRDTRKTLPGLRRLDKAAVKAAGGHNHRVGLFDQLLVKDNHILAAGGIEAATLRALQRSGGRPVQVEVTTLDELETVLDLGVTEVLLDNFTPDEARLAVRRASGRAQLEASGNITLDTVAAYAASGVDTVAVGALTHSAPWVDVAMDVRPDGMQRWQPARTAEWDQLTEMLDPAADGSDEGAADESAVADAEDEVATAVFGERDEVDAAPEPSEGDDMATAVFGAADSEERLPDSDEDDVLSAVFGEDEPGLADEDEGASTQLSDEVDTDQLGDALFGERPGDRTGLDDLPDDSDGVGEGLGRLSDTTSDSTD